jgi:hypothetical protein
VARLLLALTALYCFIEGKAGLPWPKIAAGCRHQRPYLEGRASGSFPLSMTIRTVTYERKAINA